MRTKTLLVAVAALALSLATSQAQVYSANVVGYASVPLQSSVTYLLTCPFTVGVSNGANEVFNPPLPDFSQLNIWNGGGYDTYFSDSTSPSLWDDVNQNPIGTPPSISVAQGFFLIPSATFTWKVGLTP